MLIWLLEKLLKLFYATLPQAKPSAAELAKAKIVAHRGVVSAASIENTLPAFQLCLEHKIWGVEFDLRWTADNVPIILHDDNCARLFGHGQIKPLELTWIQLQQSVPQIPTLYQAVELLQNKCHMMIEIKTALSREQKNILFSALDGLIPIQDFHLLTLSPQLLNDFDPFPQECFLFVAETNIKEIAQLALQRPCAGVAGHFTLITNELHTRLVAQDKAAGVGYVDSLNSLYREMNRGFTWFFSNDPVKLYKSLNHQG